MPKRKNKKIDGPSMASKLRDRKTLSAPAFQHEILEESSGMAREFEKWTVAEDDKLIKAIRQHGTADPQKLADAVGTRTADKVDWHFKNCARKSKHLVPNEMVSTTLDQWLNIILNSVSEDEFVKRVDQVAVTSPLILAAEEEDRLAEQEGRDSLSGVYRFLTDVARGVVPAEPGEADSRRLLALMHHLAALLKTINLSRHKRWLWTSPLLRKLIQSKTYLEPEGPAPEPDLSLVPADMRPLIGELLEPSTNPLQMPAPLAINPLTTQMNEAQLPNNHQLLGNSKQLWESILAPVEEVEDEEGEPAVLDEPFHWPAPPPSERKGGRAPMVPPRRGPFKFKKVSLTDRITPRVMNNMSTVQIRSKPPPLKTPPGAPPIQSREAIGVKPRVPTSSSSGQNGAADANSNTTSSSSGQNGAADANSNPSAENANPTSSAEDANPTPSAEDVNPTPSAGNGAAGANSNPSAENANDPDDPELVEVQKRPAPAQAGNKTKKKPRTALGDQIGKPQSGFVPNSFAIRGPARTYGRKKGCL